MHTLSDFVLNIENLRLGFGQKIVLDELTLNIPRGAVVGLIGGNGSGKSTLIRAMLGLMPIRAGKIEVLGEHPYELSHELRNRIGYAPQSPDLIEWMTVGQHLDYIGGFYERWDAGFVAGLCDAWQLDKGAQVSSLSLGGKQKLGLLLAMGHTPELLFLDEPVASLDPLARREFMRALFERNQDQTIIVSSHLLFDLQRVVSHIAFLKDGRLALFDEWDVLMESLVLILSNAPIAPAQGLIVARQLGERARAVVDRRVYPAELIPADALMQTLNLDDLFVEMLS